MSLETLKKKAKKALMAGKYADALSFYSKAHSQDESDLRIFTKVAEMKEKTGDLKGAIRAYTAIAKAYADDGFIVQAIAINKLVLRLDPEQTEIKEKLRDLSTERGDDWAISTIAPHGALLDDVQASPADKAKLSFERTPLLSGLAGQELDDFIDSLELKEYAAGDTIYQAKQANESLFLIGMGSVRLETEGIRGAQQVFSRLGEGDFFGELSFMSQSANMDSAIAESDVSLLIIHRPVFDNWVKKYPTIHETVEDFYRRRVLARILAITPVFEGIPQEARVPLAQQFSLSFFHDGDTIISEGDVESTFFLIRAGHVQVSTTNKKDPKSRVALGTLGEGSFFGEVSMLTNMPRTASVTAKGSVELLTLSGEKFNVIAKQFPTVRKVVEAYLKQRVRNTIKTLKDNA
ncbi:MAG: cyclic nucleotide-binding domain-containing protein [Ghiorsea sp.]